MAKICWLKVSKLIQKIFLLDFLSVTVALVSCSEKMTLGTSGGGEVLSVTRYMASVGNS